MSKNHDDELVKKGAVIEAILGVEWTQDRYFEDIYEAIDQLPAEQVRSRAEIKRDNDSATAFLEGLLMESGKED